MSADTKNRGDVRKAFAALLNTALVGTGKPCAEVTDYQKDKIDKTPIVMVMSEGSGRSVHGIGAKKFANLFNLELHTLIRDADASGLTDSQREDRLDLIDKMIADVVADNQSNANWDQLVFLGDLDKGNRTEKSQATKVAIDGKAYLLEITRLEVRSND